ncbi:MULTISPECIES: hypothetical protein [Streptomyces]|uniref:Uncharacterized protein n=1 Tax=Streptomyces virginiae TaxID=1961 RepID=A0ABQ3NQ12_STRVG|nr:MULTISPECIES: hypothetical protein [Streptomyces]KOU82868.1 hypothetical protein ADK94_22680 [Streptomyces sp. XY593]MBP2341305.1 hypothetical protein [Streptomyces virginiae]GGQ19383.1 hypothetical protein GCM10010215_50060 [Streptomyces virginiae]GHI14836.1 hypothetical protein Scinn_42990 [Streptomyces virginiae]
MSRGARLIPVGFYSDIEFGTAGQPTLYESIIKPHPDKGRVLGYLRSAYMILVGGMGMRDELSPDREFVDEFKLMTDGVWIWPSSYPHYVERYDAEIPPRLAELAASRNWEPPTFHDEEFEDRMPFSD